MEAFGLILVESKQYSHSDMVGNMFFYRETQNVEDNCCFGCERQCSTEHGVQATFERLWLVLVIAHVATNACTDMLDMKSAYFNCP